MEDKDVITVSEEDVAELCEMDIGTVKTMIRPDTTRIGKSFDAMMAGVKRRSSERHQDPNTAIERCFTAFSGRRRKTSLSVHEFARRLSVLSMEWSGNFSMEEYLALAQDIGEQDTPGIVTLESFKCAANVGPASLAPEYAPRWRKKGNQNGTGSTVAKCTAQEANAGGDGCEVNEFDDEVREEAGLGTPTARGGGGRGAAAKDALETTLRQAASKARSAGEDVWKLLDVSMTGSLAEIDSNEDDEEEEEPAAQTSLSPEILHRFLSKLDVRILPSPPRPPSPHSPSVVAEHAQPYSRHTAGEQQQQQQQQPDEQVSDSRSTENRHDSSSPAIERREEAGEEPPTPFLLARKVFEEKSRRDTFEDNQRGFRGRRPVKSGASSPPTAHAAVPSSCDRYLRDLSRDTASVRCRLQFYNDELARRGGEAQSLISRAPAREAGSRPSSLPPPSPAEINDGGCEPSPQLSSDINASRSSPRPSSGSVEKTRGRDAGGHGLIISIAAEVGGGTGTMSGGRGGGGAVSMSPTGSIVAFSRISPVEKADPSHPRIELTPRSRSTPPSPSPLPSARSGQAQPGRGGASPPSGGGGRKISSGMSPQNSSGDETKDAPSDLVSKLLLSALEGTRKKGAPSPVLSPATLAEKNRKIAVVPKADRFDPPSIRNGLAGLTTDQVDNVLLRVEASIPGAVSSWKSPVRRSPNGRGPQVRGLAKFSPIPGGRGLTAETQQQHRGQARHSKRGSIGWFGDPGSSREGGARGKGGGRGEGRGAGGAGDGPGGRAGGGAGDGVGVRAGGGAGGGAGDGAGVRAGDGAGGGAGGEGGRGSRRIWSMMKGRKTPRPQWKRANRCTIQSQSATAQQRSPELRSTWGIEPTEWEDNPSKEESNEEFTAKNPMYARPVEVVQQRKVLERALSAPLKSTASSAPKGTGVSSFSPSQSLDHGGSGRPEYNYYGSSGHTAIPARGTNPRPVQVLERLGEADIYGETFDGTKTAGSDISSFSLLQTPGRSGSRDRSGGGSPKHDHSINPAASYRQFLRGESGPVRTFQWLGEDVYNDFVNSAKLKTEFSGFAPSQLVGRHDNDSSYGHGASYQLAGSARRAERSFQRLDEDLVDGFMNCTKTSKGASKGARRTAT